MPCGDGLARHCDQKVFGWGCREATVNSSDAWAGDFPLFLSLPSSCRRGGDNEGHSLLHEENSPGEADEPAWREAAAGITCCAACVSASHKALARGPGWN